MEELGPPASGAAGPAAADLIPGDLAKGVKTGYQFILLGGANGYAVNANPVTFGSTGRRTFFSDQTHVIRQNWTSEPATANSEEIK
jgi:type IV pilus assembly protein PilA